MSPFWSIHLCFNHILILSLYSRGGSIWILLWICCGGYVASDAVRDLFNFEGILNWHDYHSILQQCAIPSGLHLARSSFIFQQDYNSNHTSRLRVMEHSITATWPKPRWAGLGWDGPRCKKGQQVLSITAKSSIRALRRPFQVTASWS